MVKKREKLSVALESLGCKLNQAEMQQLADQLAAAGYHLADPGGHADIYILNTCTVTQVADGKSRHMLRAARRQNPSIRLVAIGCYAERAPRELAEIEGVELVLGNREKLKLLDLLEDSASSDKVQTSGLKSAGNTGRTRAFIKVQDGCRNFCAYCIVPYVRNRAASVPVEDVIARVKGKAAAGHREVVLTGTEIGTYKDNGLNLTGLLERILVETNISRLRLSSVQPHHITPELIALWKDTRLCPHFHLSLQSGSNTVLRRMKRRYSTEEYRNAMTAIRSAVPDAAITTDVIVGFPGETEAEFQESYDFCRQSQFARIHVFSYSPRPGTEAATMSGQVPEAVKKERSRQTLELASESARSFQERYFNKNLEVLWEQKAGRIWSGLTGNYIKVYIRSSEELGNSITAVKLIKQYRDGVWGER